MTSGADSTAQGVCDQPTFVSDALHNLSQPLTALQCSLELSLARDQTSEEFRASVQAALQNAQRLRQGLLLLRALSDADDHGDISAPVELRQLLLGLQEDFLPVFESSGGRFDVVCDPVQVRGNAAKLGRALFYLLDYLLRRSAQISLSARVEKTHGHVEIRITLSHGVSSAVPSEDLDDPMSAGEVEIARRTFRAVGGDLLLAESTARQTAWIARLPLAECRAAEIARLHPKSGSRRRS